jgi:hypothetical protein
MHAKVKPDKEARWFGNDDRNFITVQLKDVRKYLVDLSISMHNATPFATAVDERNTVDELFKALKQSEAVASNLLRHNFMFQVFLTVAANKQLI